MMALRTSLAGARDSRARFSNAESAWSNGAAVGFALGAGFVGALWLLSKAAHGRGQNGCSDPYENVPYDDEEPSEEEMRQVEESLAEIARGEVIPAHLVLPRRASA